MMATAVVMHVGGWVYEPYRAKVGSYPCSLSRSNPPRIPLSPAKKKVGIKILRFPGKIMICGYDVIQSYEIQYASVIGSPLLTMTLPRFR